MFFSTSFCIIFCGYISSLVLSAEVSARKIASVRQFVYEACLFTLFFAIIELTSYINEINLR